jgi:hypothetical protein
VGAGSEQPAATKGGVELADIFRAYGESYRRNHPLPVSHLKVMQADASLNLTQAKVCQTD